MRRAAFRQAIDFLDGTLVEQQSTTGQLRRTPDRDVVPPPFAGGRSARAQGKRAIGRFLASQSGVWLWFWRNIARADGGPVFDVLAVLAAAQPAFLETETRYAKMEGEEQLIVRSKPDDGRKKVRFCRGFARKTKGVVLRRLQAR
ncbi:MAG: hypothetical protein H0V54_04910 [Chthoniobacterales bacterium]|nr:hypothetical protein [Chthoniobacterales bacterium]